MKHGTDRKNSSKTDTGRTIDAALTTDGPMRDIVVAEMNEAIAMLMKRHGGKVAQSGDANDRERSFKVSGSAMAGIGICDGDSVLVDVELEAKSGDLVLVSRDGIHFEVRSLLVIDSSTYLHAEDASIPDEDVARASSMRIRGVVTSLRKVG